ncbi:MAG TPA: carboxypeptidase regulatory-like domain-containing protein, partial [Dyella sp.]|uniref:TonB-dependent receptor n=1 Tax=Dyella sp. TaxID=1869338 RepID=UPI002F91FE52
MGEFNNSRKLRARRLCVALGLGLSVLAMPIQAANNDGSVVGRTQAGATVTVRDPSTGFVRSVTADEKGNYRFPFLPIGKYVLESSKDGKSLGAPINVSVSLGNATTVNLGVTELTGVNVTATNVVTAVDVTSTESATNITREELRRLPVDQNVTAVTVLAPGVNKGTAGFGGITFGGSSVAENAFYVNGLNVTDFYNRNGFSEAPYNFYQEFQVKTGGYSVEFGRTTGGVVNA